MAVTAGDAAVAGQLAEGPARDELARRGLRRLRIARGWTLAEAGAALGLHASRVSRAEAGLRRPLPPERVAEAFGVTVEEVLARCPRCGYAPGEGLVCLDCGTAAPARGGSGPWVHVTFTVSEIHRCG